MVVDGSDKGTIPEGEYNMDVNEAGISEIESMALYVTASPFEGDEECEDPISVGAPNFRISPE